MPRDLRKQSEVNAGPFVPGRKSHALKGSTQKMPPVGVYNPLKLFGERGGRTFSVGGGSTGFHMPGEG